MQKTPQTLFATAFTKLFWNLIDLKQATRDAACITTKILQYEIASFLFAHIINNTNKEDMMYTAKGFNFVLISFLAINPPI